MATTADTLLLGPTRVDLRRSQVRRADGRMMRLSERERAVLAYLAAKDGVPVSRGELLTEVWGWSASVVSRAADDLVKRLRPKLEDDPSAPRFLLTAHGVGYRLVVDRPDAAVPTPEAPASAPLVWGEVRLDLDRAELSGPAGTLPLTTAEVRLLQELVRAGGEPVDRTTLQRRTGGSGHGRGLTDLVRRLRLKLEADPADPQHLVTVRGVGYALTQPPTTAPRPLRARTSGLVGRDALLESMLDALAGGARVLRIVGPAGAGKSRLARELTADAARAWRVEVDGITDAAALIDRVTREVRGASGGARPAQAFSGAPCRLLLDGVEALADSAPIGDWLRAHPQLAIVLVGRRAPPVPDAVSFAVGALSPEAARALFTDRATQARPGWSADPAELDALLDALDHLPLPIELAAARVALLSIPAILHRLTADLGLLQRSGDSWRATVNQSWDLLSDTARRVLVLCSALPGAADLDLLEAVCGMAGLDGAQELLDLHLLERITSGAAPRLRPYALVRAFAREHLTPEVEATALDALATHLAHRVDTIHLDNDGLAELRHDVAAIEAAAAVVPADDPRLWSLARARLMLGRLIGLGKHGTSLADRIAAAEPPSALVGGRTWTTAAIALVVQDAARTQDAAERAILWCERAGDPTSLANAEGMRALLCNQTGDPLGAATAYAKGADLARAGGDRTLEVRLRTALAGRLRHLGRPADAEVAYQAALDTLALLDDPGQEAICRLNRAVLSRSLGRYDDAVTDLQRASERAMAMHLPVLESVARQNLGLILGEQGRLAESRRELALASTLAADNGNRLLDARVQTSLGWLELEHGDPERARRMLLRALAEHEDLRNPRFAAITSAMIALVPPVESRRIDAAILRQRASGHREDLGSTLVLRARVREALGDTAGALADLNEALQILDGVGDPYGVAWALASIARLEPGTAVAPEHAERARRLADTLGVRPEGSLHPVV
ncbi:MAG: DNA-binding response OmpR family regulator/tetratricopeptide (TPR) repeat protein, partial [Myxococcota bacterium]